MKKIILLVILILFCLSSVTLAGVVTNTFGDPITDFNGDPVTHGIGGIFHEDGFLVQKDETLYDGPCVVDKDETLYDGGFPVERENTE